LIHITSPGFHTAPTAAQICAIAFGKQEEEDRFEFSQAHVDTLLVNTKAMFDGDFQLYFAKTPYYLKPVEAICISDHNKMLLMKSSTLIPLLLSALFLDADHVLSDLDQGVKAAIQNDSVNCFLQIALFAPGRDLLAAEGAAVEALHTLAGGRALTPEAKLAAAGAIMAIEGRAHDPHPDLIVAEHGAESKHVMVSCE
jgi:hypothetical protein